MRISVVASRDWQFLYVLHRLYVCTCCSELLILSRPIFIRIRIVQARFRLLYIAGIVPVSKAFGMRLVRLFSLNILKLTSDEIVPSVRTLIKGSVAPSIRKYR